VPPEGRKLLVLGTTSQGGLMQEMELASAFNVVLSVPMLEEAQIAAVMASLGAFAPQDVRPLPTRPAMLSRSSIAVAAARVAIMSIVASLVDTSRLPGYSRKARLYWLSP